jgi:hypothetical protein
MAATRGPESWLLIWIAQSDRYFLMNANPEQSSAGLDAKNFNSNMTSDRGTGLITRSPLK